MSPTLPAQTTTPPGAPTPAETDEDVVTLDLFTVNTSKDTGYVAVDALAGGRQNTPLRVTPSTVSSITAGFINDLGLTSVQDALQWTLNTIPTNFRSGMAGGNAGDTFNYWSVSIRGDSHVQGGNPPTKNYFPTFMLIDTYNIDRIEVDAGPNSILFGIGDIGGSLTSYTKTARFGNDFSTLGVQATSFGGLRGTIDSNQTYGDRFALRVNALLADQKGWQDGDFHKKEGITLAGTYKFSDSTQVRFELEGRKEKKTVYAATVQDGISLWDGTTESPTWGAAVPGINANPLNDPTAPGVHTMEAWGGPANYLVWNSEVGLFNWAGGARSMGTGDVAWGAYLRPDAFTFGPTGTLIPEYPRKRSFAIIPTDGLLKPEAIDGTLTFEQRINANSELQISGYGYEDSAKARNFEGAGGGNGYGIAVDLNRQLPDGTPNPNFGKYFSDMFLDEQQQNHKVFEVRGQYSYHFDTEIWGVPLKQMLSVSAGHQVTDLITRQHQATVLNNYDPNNWTRSMVWGRIYWDRPRAALRVPKTYNGQEIEYIGLPFNWYDWNIKQRIDYFGAFSQSRLWEDRLNITLGVRRDKYRNTKDDVRGTNDTTASDAGTTFTAGLVGYITPWLGVVGNVSENFQPAAGGIAPSLYGANFGPSFGKGRNVGLRISTQDGKYWASASYYKDKSTDVIGGDSPDFQGIWNDYFTAGGTSTDIGPAGNVTGTLGSYHANMNYTDTYDVDYHGVELEFTANPTKNLRIQAHYAVPRGVKTNNAPNARRYFDQYADVWQVAASGTSPESTKLASDLSNAANLLANTAEETVVANLAKRQYNIFATYSFDTEALDGLEVGLGLTGLGPQYRGPGDKAQDGTRFLSPAYSTWSLMIGYSQTFETMGRQVRARYQLNVDNLFDNDRLIFGSFQNYGASGNEPMNYRYLEPQKFTFTATFSF